MSTINIAGTTPIDDPSYRYKMPRIQAKVEGRGNGIKTVLVNVNDVSLSLNREAPEITKFFGCELGSQTTFSAETDRAIVNGAHTANDLQTHLSKYIENFVLCANCRLPETHYKIKSGLISQKCLACGHKAPVDMNHKLTTFILAQHKKAKELAAKGEKDKEKKKDKKEKKDKSGDGGEDEDASPREDKEKKSKKDKKDKKEKSGGDGEDKEGGEEKKKKKSSSKKTADGGDKTGEGGEDSDDLEEETDSKAAGESSYIFIFKLYDQFLNNYISYFTHTIVIEVDSYIVLICMYIAPTMMKALVTTHASFVLGT